MADELTPHFVDLVYNATLKSFWRRRALGRGYRIFREPFATRIDTDADDLDKRVAAIVRTWLEAMAEPPAA